MTLCLKEERQISKKRLTS